MTNEVTNSVGHISLRVESSEVKTRADGMNRPGRSAFVRGVVCTPPHMAGTAISMFVLHYTGPSFKPQESGTEVEAIPPNTLLLCHACRPQFDRSEMTPAENMGDVSVAEMLASGLTIISQEGFQWWSSKSAQWCGDALERDMLYGMSRVSVTPEAGPDQRARAHIDILKTHLALKLTSLNDLVHFFRTHMDGVVNGAEHNANSLIRLISTEAKQMITLWVYSARKTVELPGLGPNGRKRTFNVPGSSEETWNDAIVKGNQAKGLAQVVASAFGADIRLHPEHAELAVGLRNDVLNGKILVEAIPGERIRILGDSLQQIVHPEEFPGSVLAKHASQCWGKDRRDKPFHGFLPMHTNVIVNQPQEGSPNPLATVVAAKFVPEPDVSPCTPQDMETANYTPSKRRKSSP